LYQVRAIVKDNPVNSSLQFDMLVPMAARLAYRKSDNNNWGNLSYRTFVKVYANTNIALFTKNATALSQQIVGKNRFFISITAFASIAFRYKII
jgi:putative ABC transport system permease protein